MFSNISTVILMLLNFPPWLFLTAKSQPVDQQQQQYQLRLHHPVGNFSAAYSSGQNPHQSIYSNIGQTQPRQVVHQRTIYYPCLSRCQPYRWTYRWSTANIPPQPPPLPSPPQPIQPPAPASPVQPAQPNVRTALIRFVFPSQPNPFVPSQNTTIAISPTTISTAILTTESMTTTITSTAAYPFYFRTTSTYELPTPPPYTQNGPGVPDTIVRLNSCPHGQPLMNEYHNPMTCNFVVKPNGGCPEHYWCHTGSSFETTTCCPDGNHKNRCQLPRSNGEGEDLIPRWYFDIGAHKCKRFLYKGMRGNANNFVTAMSCAEACETAEQAAAVRNPCAIGPPARDLTGQQFLCGTSDSRCPAGYYCHLGELASANVCCELSAAATDRCNLAVHQGEGSANLRRFYFNTLTRKCVEFVYRGTKGNENNFLALDECKTTCEKLPNPCPMLFDFGERKECVGKEKRCGKGEWCHLGSSKETTACCPAAAIDPCKLPLDLGQGVENLSRWYGVPSEDPCSRECRPFQYRGMKGNQNNFPSKTECEANCKADCPIALNPCADEELLLDPEGRPQRCNATGQCPADYWCHIGANPETTVCCSGVERACTQPLAEGFGNALLSRWYYNAKEGNCQKFIYRGIGGNRNNYVDYEDCMNACPDSVDNQQQMSSSSTTTTSTSTIPTTNIANPQPILLNPCGTGEPLTAADDVRQFMCSPDRLCPDTHFCHINQDQPALSNQCCLKNGDPCEQSPAEGKGDSRLDRFYFDPVHLRCRHFIYRGSRGNANNFLSNADCEYVCLSPHRSNPCPVGQPLADDSTEPLVCGNSEAATSVASNGCPSDYWCHVGSSPETTNCCPRIGGNKRPCELPLELGHGTERLDRWYYDGTAQACRRFWYTGLKGNANNFLTREQCQQHCFQLLVNQGQIATEQPIPSDATADFCLRGEPLMRERSLLKCGLEDGLGAGECPETHFCHLGHTQGHNGCCLKTGADRCLLPLNRGIGPNTHIRWHFNSATRRCEAFDYAGLKGNENNFITKRHCEEHCIAASKAKKNYCPHGEPKWENGGKALNPHTCGPDKECPSGYVCHLSAEAGTAICCEDPAYFCLQLRDPGPCKENLIRYGYNPLTDTCVSYRYGGCGGTLNQFESQERCTEICCRQYKNRR